MDSNGDSILEKLDSIAPLKQFDAFPKLPNTYRSRTSYGGFMTIGVLALCILLVLNDLAEFLWGWPDYEFDVDKDVARTMAINVDLVVAMPCHALTVDLRDAVGDRVHLSNGFRRDGTTFDASQANTMQTHATQLSAKEVVTSARRSTRGFFDVFRRKKPAFRPTYNHKPAGSACRVYGSLEVKKVTANLHITSLGHGYRSSEHTDHNLLNFTHVITEFSFGPYFPDIVQPLDYSLEVTHEHFTAFQYFINVVPTTYWPPRTRPLRTNQYSVTNYIRQVDHGQAPGIFFKFDMDPMAIAVHQRTTSFYQFLLRVIGVVGGVWVCAGWAIKVSGKAIEVVAGPSTEDTIAEVGQTSARKSRWGGSDLNRRKGNWNLVTSGWEGGSNYGSYPNTPASGSFGPVTPASPYFNATPTSPHPSQVRTSGTFPASPLPHTSATSSHFPASPSPLSPGFPSSPASKRVSIGATLSPMSANRDSYPGRVRALSSGNTASSPTSPDSRAASEGPR